MANVTFWKGTRAAYDALQDKLDTRLYFVEDEGLIYKGETVYSPVQNNTLDSSSTNDNVPGSKAVYDYVAANIDTLNEKIAALGNVLRFKGVLADETALNAVSGMKVGDVYYVIDGECEFVYVNGEVGWEKLGPTVDYSVFAQKNEVVKLVADAAADHVVVFQAGGELKDSGYTVNTGSTYAGGTPDSAIVVTETVLAGVVANIVAGDLGDTLNGKMGIVATGKAGELLVAKADGNSEVSGFTADTAATIAEAGATSDRKLVNETAVRTAIDAAAPVWIEG